MLGAWFYKVCYLEDGIQNVAKDTKKKCKFSFKSTEKASVSKFGFATFDSTDDLWWTTTL